MTFPATPLDLAVELSLGGVWTDITDYVKVREGIAISRGRSDEGGGISPATCRLTLINRDGRFSPRNPMGPYYGKIGRNTPIRVSALLGDTRLFGTIGGLSTPDSAALSITGDLDVRADMRQPKWNENYVILAKWGAAGQRSWRFYVGPKGQINLDWTADGTTQINAFSTLPVPTTAGRQAIRATLDVNNGAGGRTVTFYTAPTLAGPWTQLGTPVVRAGVTSIFDSTMTVDLYTKTGWEWYAAEVRNGDGGPVVASPTLTGRAEAPAGASGHTFTDAQGNVWTKSATPAISARRYRFHGEVSSWPQSWDISGTDVTVTAEAAGVFRRLGQGAGALQGPIQRAVLSSAAPAYGYWPLEDASGSTSMASGLPGGPAMAILGTPELAASEDVFTASNPLPVLSGNPGFVGTVNSHAATGTVHVHFLMRVPAAGITVDSVLLRVSTTGDARLWDLRYSAADGGLTFEAWGGGVTGGTRLFSSGASFAVKGKPLIVVVEMVQNGADIDWKLITIGYTTDVGLQITGTLAGYTVGAAKSVEIAPIGGAADTVVGHLTVNAALPGDIESPLRGWAGETAARRVQRLATELGIPVTIFGDPDESVALGVQRPDTLLNLLAEAEEADLGQVFESRDGLGICYRTRDSRQYQAPALALAYTDLTELTPVEDDQGTRNDVTVTRTGGSSARATLDTGALSTQAPPAGVGRYAEDVELNLYSDAQLADHAQYRVTLGTIDQARYPDILARLETGPFANDLARTTAALDVEIGDLLTVSGLPAWLPPDQVRQHTIGQSELLGAFDYGINFTCVPAVPAAASGLWDSPTARYSGDGSTLSAPITASATSLAIATPAGAPLWTTDPADFPLDILVGGERITLSAITGTSSPQTATVSARSVNGVTKSHLAGAALDVADPFYYTF